MGHRYIIEIDMNQEQFEKEGHMPKHISRVINSFEGIKVISMCAKACEVCNPSHKGGCKCGQSNFVEDSNSEPKKEDL